ncbi:MAG: DUF1345 domain-containing protein [Sphingomicrobium sp.]|nr:DUF1345 domain-containing protein [Sphingomonadales bacterium]
MEPRKAQLLRTFGNRIAPWRFLLFIVLLGAGWIAGIPLIGWSKGILAGFDGAALVFLGTCMTLFDDKPGKMREVSRENDANRATLLIISSLLTIVILAAVIGELGKSGQMNAWNKGLVAVSLVLVWLFGNAVYTLHYCHLFYSRDDGGNDAAGLDFPGTKEPLMGDFVYFAYTLGVAVQTSDVAVTSPHIRKVVTAHCVVGFFFNLGVLALTINVLGSS